MVGTLNEEPWEHAARIQSYGITFGTYHSVLDQRRLHIAAPFITGATAGFRAQQISLCVILPMAGSTRRLIYLKILGI